MPLIERLLARAIHPAPAAHRQAPRGRHLGDHGNARTDVLRPLVVVRRRRQHRVRPRRGPIGIDSMERPARHAECVRVAADVVAGDEPRVRIEAGVLDALCRDRRRVLLEAHRKAEIALGDRPRRVGRRRRQQQRADEVEDRRIGEAACAPRARHGPVDVATILRRDAFGGNVGPVDREPRHGLGKGFAQRVEREIARTPVGAGDLQRVAREPVEACRERAPHDAALALVGREFRSRAPLRRRIHARRGRRAGAPSGRRARHGCHWRTDNRYRHAPATARAACSCDALIFSMAT